MSSSNVIHSSAGSSHAVDILPIPPPLEFPYPQPTGSSSLPNSAATSTTAIAKPSPEANGWPTHAVPQTPGLLEKTSKPIQRPSVSRRRFETERPQARQRVSLLGIKRRQTGEPVNTLDPELQWSSEEDSSSSSEDEGDFQSPSSKLRAIRKSRKGQNKDMGTKQKSATNPYSRFSLGNDNYKTRGKVSKDGRLNISLRETANRGYLAKALGTTLRHHLSGPNAERDEEGKIPISPLRADEPRPGAVKRGDTMATTTSTLSMAPSAYETVARPTLNIVIMVIGSRGDIQPFLRLGKILKEEHGHRVRIATHPVFKKFVEKDSGLEFFSVGGDPAELMAFMVKNPGLIPKAQTIKSGDIGRRRDSMYEMFNGFWRACINATDDEKDVENLKMMGDKHPFIADAIIANPVSYAHIHCAERLGIPLHLIFTFPNSPTQQFPHPLANIKQTNVDANYTNFMTYPLVEMMIWQGLGDLINKFRVKTLGLEPMSTLWAPGQLFRLKVPYTYLWSPGLIPKPEDWGPEIDIAGFVFLDLASSFKPPEGLTNFLEAGEKPVYIGFGSIVVDDPDKFTSLIFEAVKKAGVRALVSKGWGGLGDENNTPDNIFMLENTPHDWLFPKVSAVVHHGGAGTTAIGLKCGKPTMIVPFFGDQPFWGAMVAKAGAGPEPVPYKQLTADKLAEGLEIMLKPETQKAAQAFAQKIEEEGDGAVNAVKSFHRSLPLRGKHSMRCSILEDRVAVWHLKGTHVRLSAAAAEVLVVKRKLKWSNLRTIRHYDWNDFEGPGEPLSGFGTAVMSTVVNTASGVGSVPFRMAKTIKRKEKADARRKSLNGKSSSTSQTPLAEKRNKTFSRSNHLSANSKSPDGNQRGGSQEGEEKDLPDGGTPSQRPLATPGDGKEKEPQSSEDSGDDENLVENLAHDAESGFAKAGGALAKAPLDISLAVARGFHNAPRLYGDTTVRTPRRITGYKSGLKAAGEGFAYGVYDGVTGIVKQPIDGAKKEGAVGFIKGMGKGVGGFVLKDLAAIFGLPAYTARGAYQELIKSRQPNNFIRRARMIQGTRDIAAMSKDELDAVVRTVAQGWRIVQDVRRGLEEFGDHGLIGMIEKRRIVRKWKKHGVFDNIEWSGKALEAHKEGKDFDEEFAELREQLRRHQGPRRSTMEEQMRKRRKKQLKGGKVLGAREQGRELRKMAEGRTVAGEEQGVAVGDKATEGVGMESVEEKSEDEAVTRIDTDGVEREGRKESTQVNSDDIERSRKDLESKELSSGIEGDQVNGVGGVKGMNDGQAELASLQMLNRTVSM